jgi:hypothetical protein
LKTATWLQIYLAFFVISATALMYRAETIPYPQPTWSLWDGPIPFVLAVVGIAIAIRGKLLSRTSCLWWLSRILFAVFCLWYVSAFLMLVMPLVLPVLRECQF